MKKLLLCAACAVSTVSFAQFEEGFESFNAGDFICVESELFEVWPAPGAAAGSDWDSQVVDSVAYEGLNSLLIEAENLAGGPMDVLLNVGKSSGNWSLDWEMMIPTGFSAYFNVQGTDPAGLIQPDSWQCNFWVATNGVVVANGPWGSSDTTSITTGQWFNVRLVVDLEQELFKLWIDGESVVQAAYIGDFSSINFYALGDASVGFPAGITETGGTLGRYYVDSFTLAESDVDLVSVEEPVAGALEFYPNPTQGQLRLSGVHSQTTLVILDLMGREVFSELLDAGQQTVQLDLPEGVYLLGTDDQENLRKLVIRR